MKLTKYPIGIVAVSIIICLIGLMLIASQIILKSSPNTTLVKGPMIPASSSDTAASFFARAQKGDISAISEYSEWLKTQGKIFQVTSSTYFLVVPHLLIDNSASYSVGYGGTALIGVSQNSLRVISEDVSPIGQFGNHLLYKKGWPGLRDSCSDKSLYSADIYGAVEPVLSYRDCEGFFTFHAPLTDKDAKMDIPDVFLRDLLDGKSILDELIKPRNMLVFETGQLLDNNQRTVTSTLMLRPGTPRLDQATEDILSCKSDWKSMTDGLPKANAKQLAALEKCMSTLGYPFKKFPIQSTSSYYGFMGNSQPQIAEEKDRVWCQIDGLPNGCLLYKVENGLPKVLKSPALTEIIKINSDGSLLVHHFPYEICLFSNYENYNFEAGTTTASIVDYTEGGSCQDQTTLTFYPKGRQVDFEIDILSDGAGGPDKYSLIYKNKSIGTITDIDSSKEVYQPFPAESDLRSYALQSDKTKFNFSVASSSYTLDLSPSIPKLIKH